MIQTFENRDYLKGLYLKALRDNDKNIKYCAISFIHEISKILGPDEAVNSFSEIFESLLKEDDPKVKEKLVKNFHEVAMVFQSKTDDKYEDSKDQKEVKQRGIKLKILDAKSKF